MIVVQAVPGEPLDIGKRGEDRARRVAFSLKDFIASFGDGVPQLTVTRPMEGCAYAAMLTREGDTAYWDISDVWTAYCGIGACQLSWFVGETLAKSEIFQFRVADSLDAGEETPEPAQQYLAQVQQLAVRAENAAAAAASSAQTAEETVRQAAQKLGEVGDMETALDSIIAIQNSLIGGDVT